MRTSQDSCRSCGASVPAGAAFCIRCGKPLAPEIDPYIDQDLLGRYHVELRLAEGGISWVYRARHAHLAPRRALKILRPELRDNRDAVDAFWRDANVGAGLRHPGFARLHDVDVLADGAPCSVWELVDGPGLAERVRQAPLGHAAVGLVSELCAAVAELHSQHLAHLDLQPVNVLIVSGEHGLEGRLVDLSEARRLGSTSGRAVEQLRLGFAAPEQYEREPVDALSDVFALAALLAYAYLGRPPIEAAGLDEYSIGLAELELRGSLDPMPRDLASLLADALSPDRTRRPADAGLLLEALETIAPESSDTDLAPGLGPTATQARPQLPLSAEAVAAVAGQDSEASSESGAGARQFMEAVTSGVIPPGFAGQVVGVPDVPPAFATPPPVSPDRGHTEVLGGPPGELAVGPDDAPPTVVLVAVSDGQRLALAPSSTVGRAPHNDVVLSDSTVSKNHARIRCDDDVYLLQDLGSRNGTRLNGVYLSDVREIAHGDRIHFGDVELLFRRSDGR